MICSKCGSTQLDGAKFCQVCGTPLQAAPAAPAEPVAPVEPVPAPAPAPEEPVPAPVVVEAPPAKKEKKVKEKKEKPAKAPKAPKEPKAPKAPKEKKGGSKAAVIVLVIVAVVAVALAGLNVWQYLGAQDAADALDSEKAKVRSLTNENEELSADMKEAEEAHAAVVVEKDAAIADLEGQLDSANSELDGLNNYVDQLEEEVDAAAPVLDVYAQVSDFLNSSEAYDYCAYDTYYVSTNVVVIPEGGSTEIFVYFDYTGSINYAWSDSSVVDCDGLGFEDSICPIVVYGVNKGVSEITFTNTVNSISFTILAVVI